MMLGVSSYSLHQAMQDGRMDILGVIGYVAQIGGEHVEIVPLGFTLTDNPKLIADIRAKAEEVGIEISNYAIGANFAGLSDAEYEAEIARVKKEVDTAHLLGVKRMRHDVASSSDISMRKFQAELPRLAEACGRIADYAAGFGITTSVENHGFFIQASDRVQALIEATGRANFKTTLDVGNFLCVDEQPTVAVGKNIGYASMVHIKDFYYRPPQLDQGEGWFRSAYGSYLRGAIVGHGDVDIRACLRIIRQSGYDGCLSVEFEGMEDCLVGARIGLEQLKRLWSETEMEATKS